MYLRFGIVRNLWLSSAVHYLSAQNTKLSSYAPTKTYSCLRCINSTNIYIYFRLAASHMYSACKYIIHGTMVPVHMLSWSLIFFILIIKQLQPKGVMT